MQNVALQSPSPQARTGQYNGVDTALDFGDPVRELAALREKCGIFALSWRFKIAVTGKDRVRWLHNMVTNNVRDLPLNHGNYNFVLNAQGRILGDLYVYNRGESLLLDTDHGQAQTLMSAMKRFIIMDKVEMAEIPGMLALGICGPQAAATLAGVGVDAQGVAALAIRDQQLGDRNITVARGPENKPNWYETWTDSARIGEVRKNLLNAGAVPVGAQALEWWRILQGIPNYGQDIRDRDLPQETGQNQALSFTKGCYIGQEIVERIRSRGQVHRKFTGFEFESALAPLGKYEAEGRTIAEITSTANVATDAGEKYLGLGYVRQEAASARPHLDLKGAKARIMELPFAI